MNNFCTLRNQDYQKDLFLTCYVSSLEAVCLNTPPPRPTCMLKNALREYDGQAGCPTHDSHTLGMDGAKVGVLEETNKIGLGSLLEGKHGRSLESQVTLEILGDLPDQTLEGELTDQEIGRLLVAADLSKSDGARTITVGLLHAS
eukprot:scaffold45673_cov70-Cyclotella_meneghiniana.AAC.3